MQTAVFVKLSNKAGVDDGASYSHPNHELRRGIGPFKAGRSPKACLALKAAFGQLARQGSLPNADV